jgi:hypothetical protein
MNVLEEESFVAMKAELSESIKKGVDFAAQAPGTGRR